VEGRHARFHCPFGRLSFRYQYCDDTGAAKVGFSLDADGVLTQTWNNDSSPAARFWPLTSGEPLSTAIEHLASHSITPEEKGRCVVHFDLVNGTYAYTPNSRYLEELLDSDESFSACGQYGDSNDGVQYWSVINGKLLAYLWIGQDAPIYDPKSFKYIPRSKIVHRRVERQIHRRGGGSHTASRL